jgi:hypothetical protein
MLSNRFAHAGIRRKEARSAEKPEIPTRSSQGKAVSRSADRINPVEAL